MNTLPKEYAPISLDHLEGYRNLLMQSGSRASDYSFANLWGWAPHYGLEWRFDDALCWIRQTKISPCHWAPIGLWNKVENWRACPEFVSGARFIRVPAPLCALWSNALGESVATEEARGQWDYLYLAKDLASLSGNRFHKKKNLVNQFQKNYDYQYTALCPRCIDDVLAMQEEWCRWRDCETSETLIAEDAAITRVLSHWKYLPGLSGGIIRVNGKPIAYTVGEALSDDTLVIHFEKAANQFKGAYQAINWLYAGGEGRKYTYINREQDLDDTGLRQAKLSYNPVDFARKCGVVVR